MKEIPDAFVQYAVEQCKILQQIASPSFHEQEIAAYIHNRFSSTNCKDTVMDSSGNVFTKISGIKSNHPIVVSAHMDTVHPLGTNLEITEKDDRIIGPSIGDNSLGLAALLTLLKYFSELQITPQQDVWLVANTCEEGLGNLEGIKAVVNRFKGNPSAYIILEGIGLGNITTQGLSVKRFQANFQTDGGHSWADFGRPSAIHEMVHTIEKILALPIPETCKTTLNVGKVEGGKSINSIAAEASFEIDVRSEQNKVLQTFCQNIIQVVNSARSSDLRVDTKIIGERPGGAIAATNPLVEKAVDAHKVFDVQPKLTSGSTDANIPLSLGYPAICIGLTEGGHSHSHNEYISIPPIRKGLSILIYLLNLLWQKQQLSRYAQSRKHR
jgi:tripeptide aminopeptidase